MYGLLGHHVDRVNVEIVDIVQSPCAATEFRYRPLGSRHVGPCSVPHSLMGDCLPRFVQRNQNQRKGTSRVFATNPEL